MEETCNKTIPRQHNIKESTLNKPSPDPAKNAASVKIGNNDALVKPPLVIAKAHLINIVENLIGIFTSSLIGIVIPQYPVWGLFFPFLKVGVIFIAALNLDPSFLIKYVLVLCSPSLIADESHFPTFWITTSPDENKDTLFLPISSSFG